MQWLCRLEGWGIGRIGKLEWWKTGEREGAEAGKIQSNKRFNPNSKAAEAISRSVAEWEREPQSNTLSKVRLICFPSPRRCECFPGYESYSATLSRGARVFVYLSLDWIPTFAGMTVLFLKIDFNQSGSGSGSKKNCHFEPVFTSHVVKQLSHLSVTNTDRKCEKSYKNCLLWNMLVRSLTSVRDDSRG